MGMWLVLLVFSHKAKYWTNRNVHTLSEKVKGSPKWLQFILRGTWMCQLNFMVIHPLDISFRTKHVSLLVAPEEQPENHQSHSVSSSANWNWNTLQGILLPESLKSFDMKWVIWDMSVDSALTNCSSSNLTQKTGAAQKSVLTKISSNTPSL